MILWTSFHVNISIQADLVLVHFALLCFTDTNIYVYIECLWQPCINQVYWHHYPTAFIHMASLVILANFQALHQQKCLWVNENLDDVMIFLAICPVLSRSVMSDSLRPMDHSPPGSSVHGNSPGKSTGLSCLVLLQGIFLTQGSSPGPPHWRRILYHCNHQQESILNGSLKPFLNIEQKIHDVDEDFSIFSLIKHWFF